MNANFRRSRITVFLLSGFALLASSCGFSGGNDNHKYHEGIPTQTVYFQPLQNAATNPGPTDFMSVPDPQSPTGRKISLTPDYFQNLDLGDIEDLLRGLGLDEATIAQLMPMIMETLGRILTHTFNGLDGLSTTGDIVIFLSAAPDPATVNDRTVRVINVNPNSPHYLSAAAMTIAVENPPGDTTTPARHLLRLKPVEPLYSRTQYLVIIPNGIKTSGGESFGPSADMKTLASKTPVSGPLELSRLEYQKYFQLAEKKLGLRRDQISLLFSLSTQTVSEDLVAIREDAKAHPPAPVRIFDYFPPLTDTGAVNWNGFNDGVRDWHGFYTVMDGATPISFPELPTDIVIPPGYFSNIALIVYGAFPSHSFLNPEKVFEEDPVTKTPKVFGDEQLEFLVALPQKAQSGPVPVIVFGHALGVCKETLIAIADSFARQGFATMGIDVLGHGSRSVSGVECGKDVDLATMISSLIYLDMSHGNTIDGNLLSIRDVFRQSAADEIQFVQMIKSLSAAELDLMPIHGSTMGDGVLDLDPSYLGFTSQSLGSVIGGTLVGVENDLDASVLNVGGGYFSDFVSIFLGDFMAIIPKEIFVGVQWVMDAGDPINYMRAVTREPFPATGARRRSLLLQEAVDDDTVPNLSTENLARVAHCDQVQPVVKPVPGLGVVASPASENLAPGVTAGLFQFYPAEHEFLLMPKDPALTIAGQEQAAIFLNSALSHPRHAGTILNTFYSHPPTYP